MSCEKSQVWLLAWSSTWSYRAHHWPEYEHFCARRSICRFTRWWHGSNLGNHIRSNQTAPREFNGRQLAVGADHRIKVVRYAYSAAQSLRSLRGAVEQLVRRAPAEGRPRHRPQFHLSHSVRVSMASRHRPSNASHRLGIRNVIAGGAL